MSTTPVTLYFLGASDTHRIEDPRPIQFHRADDEPHPYAHVTQEEADSLSGDAPDLYAVKGALSAPVSEQGDEPPTPKVKPARKSAPKAADTPEGE